MINEIEMYCLLGTVMFAGIFSASTKTLYSLFYAFGFLVGMIVKAV